MMQLKINPQVYDDLLEIRDYIAEDSQEQAVKVVAEILQSLEQIQHFPESGAKLGNKLHFNVKYRYLIVYSYGIIYYLEGDCVIVTNVLHLSRDFSAINFLD